MNFEDLVDIGLRLEAVPDALRIDHHIGAELAAVETARGVEADVLDAELAGLLAGIAAQLVETAGRVGACHAAAARVPFGPHVVAHEDMVRIEEPGIVSHSWSPL